MDIYVSEFKCDFLNVEIIWLPLPKLWGYTCKDLMSKGKFRIECEIEMNLRIS